jgi:DNA-binding response OmpR family regulator
LIYLFFIRFIHKKYGKYRIVIAWFAVPLEGGSKRSAESSIILGMKTILLVDDDQQVREFLRLALRRACYCVIEADCGVVALQMARLNLPDLIVSDIDMPGGDGASLLYEIRLDSELKSTQIVLMSGSLDLAARRKSMEQGADDFLAKPFSLQEFLSCVKARFNRASLSWPVVEKMAA